MAYDQLHLTRVGIWSAALDRQPAAEARAGAGEIERLGYGTLWVGEATRREAFANAATLLASTSRLIVATGIANIWARDAQAMAAGQLTLAEAFPNRFLLGIGVSHRPLVEGRGHSYRSPVANMVAYLDAMDRATYDSPRPTGQAPRLLAALGPKMLELARERAEGAHPYFVPVEHTIEARRILGPDRLLCPEQAVVIDSDPSRAREVARRHTATYLRLTNYARNLSRFGFADEDLAGGGSDRLVDAVVAWGDLEAVARRVRDHLDAGADHVAIQVLEADPSALPVRAWKALAEALLPD